MHTGVFAAGLVLMILSFFIFIAGAAAGIMGFIGGFILASFVGFIGFIMFIVGLVINPRVTVVTQEYRQVQYQQPGPNRYCSHCGSSLSGSPSFCPNCGNKL